MTPARSGCPCAPRRLARPVRPTPRPPAGDRQRPSPPGVPHRQSSPPPILAPPRPQLDRIMPECGAHDSSPAELLMIGTRRCRTLFRSPSPLGLGRPAHSGIADSVGTSSGCLPGFVAVRATSPPTAIGSPIPYDLRMRGDREAQHIVDLNGGPRRDPDQPPRRDRAATVLVLPAAVELSCSGY
jgi:hypothetical protein